jgi:hypothetical protein
MSTEAQRRAQVAALEEMMDILEDLTVSREEIERRIPQEALSGQIPTNVIIAAYQRRIARWRLPRDTSVEEEGEAYARLHRLVAGLHAVLVAVTQFYYPDAGRCCPRGSAAPGESRFSCACCCPA